MCPPWKCTGLYSCLNCLIAQLDINLNWEIFLPETCWIQLSVPSTNQVNRPSETQAPAILGPTPFNKVQIWLRNGSSNPGPRSAAHGPWLLAKLLAKIERLTYSLILLRYWLDWKSGHKWSLDRASNSAPGHHFQVQRFMDRGSSSWFSDIYVWLVRKSEPYCEKVRLCACS